MLRSGYASAMRSVGIRELKQNPSAIIRRVEAGETVTVTVQGREAALLGPLDRPLPRARYLHGLEVSRRLQGAAAPGSGYAAELASMRQGDRLTDPWEN